MLIQNTQNTKIQKKYICHCFFLLLLKYKTIYTSTFNNFDIIISITLRRHFEEVTH